LDNYGTVSLQGVLARLDGDSSGALNNYGLLQSHDAGYIYGLRVDNPGTIEVVAGSLIFGYTGTTEGNNNGTGDIQAGMLTINCSYTQSAGSTILNGGNISGALDIHGGLLKGTGTIFGTVSNGGQISPGFSGPDLITVQGDYTQSGAGDFVVRID